MINNERVRPTHFTATGRQQDTPGLIGLSDIYGTAERGGRGIKLWGYNIAQWRREGVCHPGQTSLLPPHPRNQICNWYSYGYNDGISVDCEQYAKLRV